MPYIALKRLDMGDGRFIEVGDPVPEAEGWKNPQTWINSGHIAGVAQAHVDTAVANAASAKVEAKELAKAQEQAEADAKAAAKQAEADAVIERQAAEAMAAQAPSVPNNPEAVAVAEETADKPKRTRSRTKSTAKKSAARKSSAKKTSARKSAARKSTAKSTAKK